MSFLTDNTLFVGIVVISLFLIWRFGIQPRLGLTNNEIADKADKMMDEVEESLTSSVQFNEEDVLDPKSMPQFN